ncbi:PrgI family protein [Spongiactinospora rosea]|uniref:PrgI family protein n=1 Tax=Spongiactinospora rosea TaxID=2248750 RepID=A0A366LL66_9ACTN|nr:PrgI family protein [Spongiactinospora rosea]RBQ14169.1 PrgI family protein [Spongiactinospora rosea]
MSWLPPIRIPADVDQEDKIVSGLTARQLAILGIATAVLSLTHMAIGDRIPPAAFAAIAAPIAIGAVVLALARRDGITLDRYLLAALRHHRSPKLLISGDTPAPLRLPVHTVTADGLIDMGPDGVAAVAEVSTVSFALSTPDEQDALVAVFGRWLNSLSGPAQILVRATPMDMTHTISALHDSAPHLPHPALSAAAHEHADFLADLGQRHDLLRRQVLLIIREPAADNAPDAAAARTLRRLEEAARLLSACGLAVRPLDHHAASALLTSCYDPAAPARPTGEFAGPGEVITKGERQ